MTKKKIIVTGASGFIGTSLLYLLKNSKSYRVIGIDKIATPILEGIDISFIESDLTKPRTWHDLARLDVYAIIHCAASIPGRFGGHESKKCGEINSKIDKLAISYAEQKKARFVYVSSSSVYGMNTDTVFKEEAVLNPADEYAKAKAASEGEIINNKRIPKHFILRVSAPYGPHQRTETVIKTFIEKALNEEPLLYYGSGERKQDFTYVLDVAKACMQALESTNSGIYNIASGSSVSMKDLAHSIIKLAKSKSTVRPAAAKDPQESYKPDFNISKAERFLDWRPAYPLRRGLAEFIGHARRGKL